MKVEQIAKLAYMTSLDVIKNAEVELSFIVVKSGYLLMTWEETPQFVRDIYTNYVKLILTYPPNTSALEMQSGWIDDQITKGWKYGKVLDGKAKTNPYLKSVEEWDMDTVNRYVIPVAVVNIFRSSYEEEKKNERKLSTK